MIETAQFKQIHVKAPDAEYSIIIGDGVLKTLPQLLTERNLKGKIAVVTNTTLAPLYGEQLVERLSISGNSATLVVVPDGEQYKTLDTVRTMYDAFIAAGLDRRSIVIGLGGGVMGDMAGFAAATYLRGVAYIQAPTSLLSMVDASVGGKVGVDVPQGKNLIGAFKQPEMVLVDTSVLKTLPDEEWRCGVAEVIKAGLISDPALLDSSLYQRGNESEFIAKAIMIKVNVVEQDPYEASIRAFLNLGHTFAHALERVSKYSWRHGEAVGWGLVAAARLSYLHGLCEASLPARVEKLVAEVGLPIRSGNYDIEDLRAAMETDKKRSGSTIRFVLLRAAGDPIIAPDVPDDKVLTVLNELKN